MTTAALDLDQLKKAAADAAVKEIEDGMILGLGTGSSAAFTIDAIGRRVAEGLRIVGLPTSKSTAALAGSRRIPLTSFAEHKRVDLTIDGADQIERRTLNLVKGRGGALFHEKIVASVSDRVIIVGDESKVVERLGALTPLPVEITPFGWQAVIARLEAEGYEPRLRLSDGDPFVTDGGNFIADCAMPAYRSLSAIESDLSGIVGVIETGLFIAMADAAYIGTATGVQVMTR